MTIRYGANGMPMPEKKKEETLQEILEVNPNKKVEVEEVVEDEFDEEVEQEEEDENEDF